MSNSPTVRRGGTIYRSQYVALVGNCRRRNNGPRQSVPMFDCTSNTDGPTIGIRYTSDRNKTGLTGAGSGNDRPRSSVPVYHATDITNGPAFRRRGARHTVETRVRGTAISRTD